jgi:hypothetical protein
MPSSKTLKTSHLQRPQNSSVSAFDTSSARFRCGGRRIIPSYNHKFEQSPLNLHAMKLSGLIGAIKVHQKMSNGENDTRSYAAAWFGGNEVYQLLMLM